MKNISGLWLILCFCAVLSGCEQAMPPDAACRVDAKMASEHQGAAACLVVINNKLMVAANKAGKLHLSKGQAQTRLSAQCAAHKAMYRDTGFNVQVEQVLGIQKDGTWLFSCDLDIGLDGTETPFRPAITDNPELDKIMFIDPFSITDSAWQHPDNFIVVRDAYVRQTKAAARNN